MESLHVHLEKQKNKNMEKIKDITFEFSSENEIKIMNTGDNRYVLKFIDPRDGYLGYSNYHFNKFVWVESKMSIWPNQPTKIDIILTSKSDKILVRVDFLNKTIDDLSIGENYSKNDGKHGISILIPTYKTFELLEEALDGFKSEIMGNPDLNYEILVGIDGCYETLEYISKFPDSENIKFYFSKENVGPYFILNSLVEISSYDNLLFFNADDVPKKNIINTILVNLGESDLVRFYYTELHNGIDPEIKPETGLCTGVFAIKKRVFLKMNGFYTWRTSADTEFRMRSNYNLVKEKILKDRLMYYRIGGVSTQLTKNKFTGYGSKLRDVYQKIIEDKHLNQSFDNPKTLKTVPLIRVY
jgi:hypothetical protein